MQVSPFRDLRVKGYLLLTAAFRSLSRLSSALSAKASTLRSYQLNLMSVSRLSCLAWHNFRLVCYLFEEFVRILRNETQMFLRCVFCCARTSFRQLTFVSLSSDVLLYLIFANFDTLRFYSIFGFQGTNSVDFLNLRNLLGFHSK